MIDLYAALGLPRGATKADIKKAYRAMAKKHHPDKGGTPAHFAVVKLAYDVLSDDKRRQAYDETGSIEDTPIDNSLAEALGIIAGALDKVLGACIQRGLDPLEIDMIGDLRKTIEMQKQECRQKIEALDKLAKQARRLAGKFKARKDAPNHLESIILGRVAALESQKSSVLHGLGLVSAAADIVSEHTFSFKPSVTATYPSENVMRMLNKWA